MERDETRENSRFIGDGFEPESGNGMSDWGASDGFSLWEAAATESPGDWLKDWGGRQETHDMFHDSYN